MSKLKVLIPLDVDEARELIRALDILPFQYNCRPIRELRSDINNALDRVPERERRAKEDADRIREAKADRRRRSQVGKDRGPSDDCST